MSMVGEPSTGRLCVRAVTEDASNEKLVDLPDLLEWLRVDPLEGRLAEDFHVPTLDLCEPSQTKSDAP